MPTLMFDHLRSLKPVHAMAENVNVEISPEELKRLENFRKLGVRPKADTVEDLQDCIVSYGQAHENITEEPEREAEPVQTQRQLMTLSGNPPCPSLRGHQAGKRRRHMIFGSMRPTVC